MRFCISSTALSPGYKKVPTKDEFLSCFSSLKQTLILQIVQWTVLKVHRVRRWIQILLHLLNCYDTAWDKTTEFLPVQPIPSWPVRGGKASTWLSSTCLVPYHYVAHRRLHFSFQSHSLRYFHLVRHLHWDHLFFVVSTGSAQWSGTWGLPPQEGVSHYPLSIQLNVKYKGFDKFYQRTKTFMKFLHLMHPGTHLHQLNKWTGVSYRICWIQHLLLTDNGHRTCAE